MMEFGLFSVLVGLVGLVSFIWLVVVAFRESVIWGFLVLIFSPISAIAFSIYHWYDAKKPFLIYLAATIVFIAIFFNAFSKMGGMEMISTTQETAEQLEKGEITEVEAAKRVAEQMESNIKRMEEAGLLGAEERKLLEAKIQGLKLDESTVSTPEDAAKENTKTVGMKASEQQEQVSPTKASGLTTDTTQQPQSAIVEDKPVAAEQVEKSEEKRPEEQKLEYGPGWSLEGALEKKREKFKTQQLDLPVPKVEGRYVPISVSRAEEYIGQQVRVIKADNRYDGLLKTVNENHLILDMQVSGGQAHFEVKRHQIQSMFQLVVPAVNNQ